MQSGSWGPQGYGVVMQPIRFCMDYYWFVTIYAVKNMMSIQVWCRSVSFLIVLYLYTFCYHLWCAFCYCIIFFVMITIFKCVYSVCFIVTICRNVIILYVFYMTS